MKKVTQQMVAVEVDFCNICQKEIGSERMHNRDRLNIVRGLFKVSDFHAHEKCLNKTIRETFKKYLPERKSRWDKDNPDLQANPTDK